MSSDSSVPALRLELRPSRQRRLWRGLTHGAAAAVLPLLLQSPWVMAVAALILIVSWHSSSADASLTLLRHGDGHWKLFEGADEREAGLAEPPFVQPWLVIVPLRLDGRRRLRRIVIFPDMLPADDFRRLRVCLRMRARLESVVGEP